MEKLVIVGAGIAGLTAAIYASRANLKPLIIAGREEGGQLMLTTEVENYPGFPEGVLGPDLISKCKEQAKKFGTRFKGGDLEEFKVRHSSNSSGKKENVYALTVDGEKIEAECVIIATGASARMLGIESEKKYFSRGVHTCATCLPLGSNVIANNSPKPIDQIEKGDLVLTHNGSFQKVVGIASRTYNGDLIRILPRYFHEEPTLLTPEHPVLVTTLDRGIGSNYGKFKWGEQKWLRAGQLTKQHILLYPIVTEVKDLEKIRLSEFLGLKSDNSGQVHYSYETYTSVRIPNVIPVDSDFMRLIGYFLAEGTVTKRGINLYFGPKDELYIKDTVKIIKKIFNYEARVKKEDSVYRIECYAGILRDFFEKLVGKYSYAKSLPHWFIYLPQEKQAELVKGYWRGDGGTKKLGFVLVTNSPKLIAQFKTILLRLGTIPQTTKRLKEDLNRTQSTFKGREIRFKHDRYEIFLGGYWLKRACEILDVVHPLLKNRTRHHAFSWIKAGFAYLPISQLNKEKYEGDVYNIAVENTNSYVTPSATVHNCDGYFYSGKDIAVIGGGDGACEESLFLSKLVNSVTIIHRKGQFKASRIMQERVFSNSKIKVVWNSAVEEILGDGKKVTAVKVKDTNSGKISEIKTDAVFLAIGHIPNTAVFKGILDLDENGYLIADSRMRTKLPGVFAAGDVHDKIYRQAITAAGMGCQAALEAERYLQ